MKLNLIGRPVVPADRLYANIDSARARGLPTVQDLRGTRSGTLFVVGGGPSAKDYLADFHGISDFRVPRATDYGVLPAVKSDIWAINGACRWLASEDIEAVFFSCDALPEVAEFARGARRAVIATQCDPAVYDALLSNGAEIVTFDASHGEIIGSGSTTATATPMTALIMGFRQVVFYGCESSYAQGKTHAYHHEPRAEEIIVELGGETFLTAPDFLKQAEELSALFHLERQNNPYAGPRVFSENSGGLLRQMIVHGHDYNLKWVSQSVANNIGSTMKKLKDIAA